MIAVPSWLRLSRSRPPGSSGSKRLTSMQHGRGGGGWFFSFLPNFDFQGSAGGPYDYASQVGTGVSSSVLMAPVQFIQRAMPEAPLVVERKAGDEWEVVPQHRASMLLMQPNDGYSGLHLWAITVWAYCVFGNAYWAIVRNGMGEPIQLWWVPPWLIEPKFPADGSEFVSHYEYRPGGQPKRLDVDEVVHFRHGINPENPRKGISPIGSVLRDIWVDDEASEFTAALLRNMGVPGIIVSPDGDVSMGPDEIKEFKRRLMEEIGGRNRGNPLVATAKTKIDKLGFSPEEMNLSSVTDRPEERVCSLLGIPAAVVGFASGLEQTKVGATMEELRKLAWTNGIIPIQRAFAEELGRSYLPLFRGARDDERIDYDRSEVEALSENQSELYKRADIAVQGGWMSVAQAKRMVGEQPETGDDVYLRKISVMPVPVGQVPQQDEPPAGNGDQQAGGQRGLGAQGTKQLDEDLDEEQHHTRFEREIAQRARDGGTVEAIAAQEKFLELLDRQRGVLEGKFSAELVEFFDGLGERAAEVAPGILEEHGFAKQAEPGDSIIVERVAEAMAITEQPAVFAEIYQRHYLNVANETAEALGVFGLATDLPDTIARAVTDTGGRRAGLVDLEKQTKSSLFTAITEGRAEGEGAAQLAKRIRTIVPRGPWSTVDIRSMVIARTETKFAQNVSTIAEAREQDVVSYRVWDARLGPTDIVCESLNGALVSADEADQLAYDEHPNGTRSFTPHFLPPEE